VNVNENESVNVTAATDRSSYRIAPATKRSFVLKRLYQGDPRLHSYERGRFSTMATNRMPTYSPDDLFDLPLGPSVIGYELVDGVPIEVTPVGLVHGVIAGEIYGRIRDHVKLHHVRGRVGVEIGYVLELARDPRRVRAPDVSFITNERLERSGESSTGFVLGFPDLAVEVVSAGSPPQLQQRIQDFLDAGTPLVWVIHAETRSATVYHADGSARLLRASDVLDGEDVLPGLQVPLRELFEA
jgi:Uma2 family endonuclease